MLYDNLLPFISNRKQKRIIFQEDNVPIPWPTLSPDLYPIESLGES